MAGAQTILTDEITKAVCKELERGIPQKSACEASGLSYDTYMQWMRKGRKGQEPYAQFAQEVNLARGKGKTKLLQKIENAADKDWRAGSWLLARNDPEEFGEKHLHKHEGSIKIDMGEMFGKLVQMLPEGERSDARKMLGIPDDDTDDDEDVIIGEIVSEE